MYLVAGRFALSLLLFGACALAAGCSGWTDGDADHTTGFTLPPSCADIDGPVAEVLREYIGDLYRTDKRLQTLETKIDNMYRRVRCILVLRTRCRMAAVHRRPDPCLALSRSASWSMCPCRRSRRP